MSGKWFARLALAVAVLGFALTTALAVHVTRKPGVFYAETRVLFLAPQSKRNPNALIAPTKSVILVASAVARMVEPDPPIGQVVSPAVTLVDEGIRNGWSVTLPNDGGQFTNNFDESYLQVQAVGANAVKVHAKVEALVASINAGLSTLQDRAGVPSIDRITTSPNPGVQLYYLKGSQPRAAAAVLVLGLSATMTVEMLLRRWRDRRVRSLLDDVRSSSAPVGSR